MSSAGFIGASAPKFRRWRRQVTGATITATLVPATSMLVAGQSLSETVNWAVFLDPPNYASSAGGASIASVVVDNIGSTGDASEPLAEGGLNLFSVTVADTLGCLTSAHIYFALMVLPGLPLTAIHALCWHAVEKYPDIMPDDKQRDRYALSELAMGGMCTGALWFMWMILGYMVTFCATAPFLGMVAHMPWIAFMWFSLLTKTRHLMRLIERVKAL